MQLRESSLHKKGLRRFISDFRLYKKHWALAVLLLPTIIYFVIFKYIPISGLAMAFKDYKIGLGIWASPWVGLDNFSFAFSTATFTRAFTNTVIISFLKILTGFPAPIILALLLNEVRHMKYKRTIQTISYLPHFLSWVIVAGLFSQLLSPTTGVVNYVLKTYFGLDKPIYFLGSNDWFRGTLIVTDIWKDVGWGSILYIASIAGIDPSMYEAAVCDGANRFQRLRYITLPSLMPTITIMLILRVGNVMVAGFDQIFNLYNPAVYKTADIIDTFVYRYGIGQMKYSLSTAVGLFQNLIGFVMVVGMNFVANKINDSGIW
ncbi:MAG TPA: ABC transporter permease subunit [Candidatus Limiplasma sp.]|nr:ABC transporter permease subunit [Candidatus Limiplasma sp.]HRX09128.1 ABC transporter permease subunit [Candidatus Limiplasma sp.]